MRYMLPPLPPPAPYMLLPAVPLFPSAIICPVMFIVPVALIIISPPPSPPVDWYPFPPPLPSCVGCVIES